VIILGRFVGSHSVAVVVFCGASCMKKLCFQGVEGGFVY